MLTVDLELPDLSNGAMVAAGDPSQAGQQRLKISTDAPKNEGTLVGALTSTTIPVGRSLMWQLPQLDKSSSLP